MPLVDQQKSVFVGELVSKDVDNKVLTFKFEFCGCVNIWDVDCSLHTFDSYEIGKRYEIELQKKTFIKPAFEEVL